MIYVINILRVGTFGTIIHSDDDYLFTSFYTTRGYSLIILLSLFAGELILRGLILDYTQTHTNINIYELN